MPKPIVWSPQQTAIRSFARDKKGSFVVIARAGTGKSTTAVGLADLLQGKVAYLAYNKSAGKELKGKLDEAKIPWTKAKAGTVHSFGLEAFKRGFPNFDQRNGVQKHKVEDIILACQDDLTIAYKGTIIKLVSLAKQHAFGITRPIESREAWLELIQRFDILSDCEGDEDGRKVDVDKLVEAAIAILKASNKNTDIIDFDDMCYLPVLLKLPFWPYDNVIMDESQDVNEIRACVAAAMLRKGGRFGAVGDDKQAIYGFTGAMSDALDKLQKQYNATVLPLTVTYRCPKKVVAWVKQMGWIEDYEAHPDAPEGEVLTMPEGDVLARKDLLVAGNAILCRNTKPLIGLAFRLIRARVPCNIEGRDIAAGLVKLATKWKSAKTVEDLETKLNSYFERERTKLLASRNEDMIAVLEDQVECLRAIIDQCQIEGLETVDAVVGYINRLFQDGVENVLVLSTIHKAKGREWNVVMWYDRANTCPSKWARQQWQRAQEDNLCYVSATRAKSTLIDVLAGAEATQAQPAKQEEAATASPELPLAAAA